MHSERFYLNDDSDLKNDHDESMLFHANTYYIFSVEVFFQEFKKNWIIHKTDKRVQCMTKANKSLCQLIKSI